MIHWLRLSSDDDDGRRRLSFVTTDFLFAICLCRLASKPIMSLRIIIDKYKKLMNKNDRTGKVVGKTESKSLYDIVVFVLLASLL